MLLRPPLTAVVLAGVLVAGCGGGGSDDVAKVKQTIRREFSALADGDATTACSLATKAGQAKLARALPGATCEKVVRVFSASLPAAIKDGLRSARISKVTINGGTATVQDADITSARGSLSGLAQPGSPPTVLQKQQDGSWKISR